GRGAGRRLARPGGDVSGGSETRCCRRNGGRLCRWGSGYDAGNCAAGARIRLMCSFHSANKIPNRVALRRRNEEEIVMAMCRKLGSWLAAAAGCAALLFVLSPAVRSQAPKGNAPDREKGPVPTSYDQVSPVLLGQESFEKMRAKDKAGKAGVM